MKSGSAVVQSLTDDKRGRVMSLFATMAFTGTTPLGKLAIGALAGGRLGMH